MYYVGIDIGKNHHFAAIIDSAGDWVVKPFQFSATKKGFDKFFKTLSDLIPSGELSQVSIGMEATGHYWMTLYQALKERGYPQVAVINPLMTAGRRMNNIRGRKTDKDDSILIAKLLLYDEYYNTTLAKEDMLILRELCRLRSDLVQTIGDLKKKIISILDKTFPEYEDFFADTFGKSSKAILNECKGPEEIAAMDTEKLAELLKKASRSRLGVEKAQELKQLAAQSIGISMGLDAFYMQLKLLLQQLELLEKQVKTLELNINLIYEKQQVTLTTIPGVGSVTAAVILGEIGDIRRFQKDRGRQLIAFAGLEPKIKKSGKFTGKAKISKRGSPYLRTAIYQASEVARQHHPLFAKIYEKQIGDGKHHKKAVIAVCNKMCHVIYALLRDGIPFNMSVEK